MAFRNIIIENPARIWVKNSQLIISTDRDHSLPAEDISALLLESRQSTITTAALSLLGQCGCAVLRGCMARCLAVYGFMPSLGLHHKSELNAFNLADDLMEPFRPVVDMLVYTQLRAEEELCPENKRLLFNCLNLDILSGDQRHSVAYAMERTVQSLQRSLSHGENLLVLPELLPPRQHRYE